MRHRILVAALASLVAMPLFSQLPKLVESVEVRVVNVDVVVRDRQGKPVRGLRKEDFELYQDGVPQTITNIYEVEREAAAPDTDQNVPAEIRRRKVLLFVDSSSLEPSRKHEVLTSAERFINNRMRPDDQTMIVSWRLGLRIVTPFTSDKVVLHRGIDQLRNAAPAGESQQTAVMRVKHDIQDLVTNAQENVLSWTEAYNRAISLVNRHSSELIIQQGPQLEALEQMVETMGGLEGKKVVVYIGAGLPDRPGAELYQFAFDQFAQYMNRTNPFDLQALNGVMGNRMHSEVEQVARRAAGYGVTMYAIDAAHTDSEFHSENKGAFESSERYSRDANTVTALKTLAEVTGGIAVANTSNFDFAFDTVEHDLDSYYSLGYKPTEEGTHRITVKMKNRAWHVRARSAFTMKSADDQMSDRAVANLYIDNLSSGWPISVRTGIPKRDGKAYIVPVEVIIPSTITLLPQEDKLVGGLVLYFVVGSGNGAMSPVIRHPQPVNIPAAVETKARAKPMMYRTALRINPGESILSVAIIDQISGTTGFARTKIAAK